MSNTTARPPAPSATSTTAAVWASMLLIRALNRQTKIYVLMTLAIGALLIRWHFANLDIQQPLALAIACALAALSQIFNTEGATSTSSFNMSWVVYGATFALLGTSATVLVIVAAHLVEWAWRRRLWYVQAFNIASFAIVATAAGLAYNQVSPLDWTSGPYAVVLLFAGNLLFTFVNHLMMGSAIFLSRGQRFDESGILSRTTFFLDLGLLSLGTSAAIMSLVSPYAIIFMVVITYLLRTMLKIPALQRQSQLDAKTGLYNAAFFDLSLEREFKQAKKLNRPLCVVMADLDRLRHINNTYGHLAGDAVLKKVAQMLATSTRHPDIVARFGGEEFALLMPNRTPQQAYVEIEAIRQAIEAAEFSVETSPEPIRATMSFGIAARNGESEHAYKLVHWADLAVYDAKRNGRNLTSLYQDEFCPNQPAAQPAADTRQVARQLGTLGRSVSGWVEQGRLERWKLSSICYKVNP